MSRRIFITLLTILAGLLTAIGIFQLPLFSKDTSGFSLNFPKTSSPEIIGFLPYWLLNYENPEISKYLTTLAYFGLRVDVDGHIMQLTNPQEKEPGWYALESGKVDPFLAAARKNNLKLSLLLASGDSQSIEALLTDPLQNARNLIKDVKPIMQQYQFQDLNLDIEYIHEASRESQLRFAQFVKEIKRNLLPENYSLTLEISPSDLIKKELINVADLTSTIDNLVIMGYDYHYSGSFVTGPVAPLAGAGTESEFDVTTAMNKALQILPARKITLGVPLYGYEWETLGPAPRSAVIPGTGVVASNHRAEEFLKTCATCSAGFDSTAQESYLIYHDKSSDTFHQIFFPDSRSLTAKITYARGLNLRGIALWALGYESDNLLKPLTKYKNR